MPLFGSKKKESQGDDIEDEEGEGLFMAQSSEQSPAAAIAEDVSAVESDADEAPAESGEAPSGVFTVAAEADEASTAEGDAEETPESDKAPDRTFTVAAEADAEEDSSVDDLMSAFQDDETHGDLADMTKDLEDVPISDLLAELREIRAMLPAEAHQESEEAA